MKLMKKNMEKNTNSFDTIQSPGCRMVWRNRELFGNVKCIFVSINIKLYRYHSVTVEINSEEYMLVLHKTMSIRLVSRYKL